MTCCALRREARQQHAVRNEILFRQDVHTLFDRGYVTVTPEYRLEVSRRIKEEFENGREYYAAHGKRVILPEATELRLVGIF